MFYVVKPEFLDDAKAVFQGTYVSITTEGRSVLGSPIGTFEFVKNFVSTQVTEWTLELNLLADFAKPHPHAAYAAYTHGFANKWTYLSRTCLDIGPLLNSIENTLQKTHSFTYWSCSSQ